MNYPKDPNQQVTAIRYLGKNILFLTPNAFTSRRAYNLTRKEPETNKWIGTIQKNDVLWDIGACVGGYTLMAAITRGCKVIAFEPIAANFANLNANLLLNDLDRDVWAYCIAISGSNKFYESIDYSNLDAPGSSDNQAEEERWFKQGVMHASIDYLVRRGFPHPTYIKIDVDGLEAEILSGSTQTLKGVKSLLVEYPHYDDCTDRDKEMVEKVESLGFLLENSVDFYKPSKTGMNLIFRRLEE